MYLDDRIDGKIDKLCLLLMVLGVMSCFTGFAQWIREPEKRPSGWHSYYNQWLGIEPKDRLDTSASIEKYSVAELKILLQKMFDADQQYRDSLYNGSKTEEKQRHYWKMIADADSVNQVILSKIIARYDWPGIATFGEQGAEIAWYIIWHSERPFALAHYGKVEQAFKEGKIKANQYLPLRDRWEASWRAR